MRRTTARRRLGASPALIAAITCGTLGGGLVGVGALGFDRVGASASAVCVATEPDALDPATAGTPDAVETPGALEELGALPADTPLTAPTGVDALGNRCTPDVSSLKAGTPTNLRAPAKHGDDDEKPKKKKKKKKPATGTGEQPSATPNPTLPSDPTGEDPIPADAEMTEDGPQPIESPAPGPTPSPRPEPTVGPSPTPSPDAVATPTPSVSPEPEPSATPEPSTSPEPSPSPEPSASPSPGVVLPPVLSVQGGKIGRPEVITRSISWVTEKVPYSQTRWWTDSNGTYRQDCSGMVSMAWHLSQRTNYWTGNLATVSYRIPSDALRPGDILLRPRQHTLIFAGWANDAHTKFNLYEEYSTGHPARYALNASLSYYLDRGFGTYRYNNIVEDGVQLPPLATPTVTVTPSPSPTTSPAATATDGTTPDSTMTESPAPESTTPADATGDTTTNDTPAGDTTGDTTTGDTSADSTPTDAPTPDSTTPAGTNTGGTNTGGTNTDGTAIDDATPVPMTMQTMSISGVQWTPAIAAAYEPQASAPAAKAGIATPRAVMDLPVTTLVAAQRALDTAVLEAGRHAAAGHSSGNDLMAAGVVLLLLAFPFGSAVRAGAWSPTAGVTRRNEAGE